MEDMSFITVVFLAIFIFLFLKNNQSGRNRNDDRNNFGGSDGQDRFGNRNGFNGQGNFGNQGNFNGQEQLRYDSRNHRVIVENNPAGGQQTRSSYQNYGNAYANGQQPYRNGGYNEQKEVSEAIRAGENALRALQNAERSLQSARGWGMLDMFGGDLISGALKHSRVSEAKRYLNEAKYQLQNFRNELADVASVQNLDIQIGDFMTFADFFFDGFLTDIIVQSRISDARRKLQDAIVQVQNVLSRLYAMR